MSYIGKPPSNAFTSLLKQDFTTSVTTGYTLDHAVNNANDIALFINFVRQEPTAAYSASGTTLTLTSATSATDDMYCVYLGQALQTVNPPNASVGTAQLADLAVTSGKLASGVLPDNTPAFSATLGTTQNISSATLTKLNIDTEVFDTDGNFDTSTYRFTPTTAGKYLFLAQVRIEGTGANQNARIKKNGTDVAFSISENSASTQESTHIMVCLDMNGSSDYVELYAEQNTGGTKQVYGDSSNVGSTTFTGIKIIGA